MRLERREKALENRNGHRRRRRPASPSIIKRLLSHEHDANSYAFNLLAMDGTDLRCERLDDRIWALVAWPSAAGYSMRLNRCPAARSPNVAPWKAQKIPRSASHAARRSDGASADARSVCRKSCSLTPSRPARLDTTAHGRFRSARDFSGSSPGTMTGRCLDHMPPELSDALLEGGHLLDGQEPLAPAPKGSCWRLGRGACDPIERWSPVSAQLGDLLCAF